MAAPGYWMNEISGALRPAVSAYYHGCMTAEHVVAMRAYLRQWIMAPVWDTNPHADAEEREWLAQLRAAIDGLTSPEAIQAWLAKAEAGGIDPL